MATITTPDYGLLKGLADGANNFLISYQNTKNIQHQQHMQELMSGVERDADGNLQLNPAMQQQRQLQQAKNQHDLGLLKADSPESQSARNLYGGYLKTVNPNVDTAFLDNVPGADIHSMDKLYAPAGAAYIKADASKDVADKNNRTKEDITDKKINAPTHLKNTDWAKMGDDIDPTKARQGTLADSQKLLNTTERVHQIFAQFPNGQIPAAQTAELANAVAALYGGGSAQSQHQINMIVPSSMQGDTNKILSYFMNTPEAMSQPEFIKVMRESSEREADLAKRQIHSAVGGKMSKYSNQFEENPEKYKRMFRARGILDTEFGQHGEYVEPAAAPAQGLLGQGGAQKIKVSNGKETRLIDASDLKDAMADGYQAVK